MPRKTPQFKKIFIPLVLIVFSLLNYPLFGNKTKISGKVKNVIVMIPDGCSSSIQTLARLKKGAPLALDELNCGAVKTYAANSLITDSAASATAFATGYKTTVGFISVAPRPENLLSIVSNPTDKQPFEPLATVLEGARLMGKAIGLVATSRITHATPAAFVSHLHSRNMENEIMEQMVYQDVDVVLGGGKGYLLPKKEGGWRADKENLLQVLQNRGIVFANTRAEMEAVTRGKLWGLFSRNNLAPDLDRKEFAPLEPSLAKMTEKALQILSQDEDGFFLVVEGSQVDWGAHAHDIIHMVSDFLAFDEAVRKALDYAKKEKNTLVLVFPDHNTGALSIGSEYAKIQYSNVSVDSLIKPLSGMKLTSKGLVKKIGTDLSPENIAAVIKKWWNIDASGDIEKIIQLIKEGKPKDYVISGVIGRNHTILGWTTYDHTGEDVPLWSFGPNRPCGLYDNTELAHIIADALGIDLKSVNKTLFVEVGSVFKEYYLDTSDPQNPVLKIGRAALPVNKDLLHLNNKTYRLNGIVVYAPMIKKGYIPLEAVKIIKKAGSLD